MGKKQAAPKRKSDQALAPAAAELPERKRARKQAEPAQQLDQNGKSKPKAEQKPKAAAEKKKKAEKPNQQPKAEEKPKKRQSKRSKKQQQEEEDEADQQLPEEEEQLEDEDQEQQEPEKSVHDVFMEEVHAKEQELQKHCLIMGQVETDEDETTLEELRALTRVFVPEKVQEDFVEVWEQLDEVGEDSDEEEEGADEGEGEEGEDQDGQPDILGAIMKAILGGKMLNTKHSSQMHTIFKTHQDQIDKAIKSKSWQEAFCKWAAILMAAHREKHWYEDTDMPEDAEAVCKRMQQQWKKLKARSDAELGGLVAEGSKTAKEEFEVYLEAVAEDMRSIDYSV